MTRTQVGDVFRDPLTGELREVVAVWSASEYIAARVDGRYYQRRADESTALINGAPARSWRRPLA